MKLDWIALIDGYWLATVILGIVLALLQVCGRGTIFAWQLLGLLILYAGNAYGQESWAQAIALVAAAIFITFYLALSHRSKRSGRHSE